MWTALFKLFSVLGRAAAFAFAVVTLALISLTLAQRDWMDGISIYIVVMSVVSIFAALIPPYSNFVYDLFFSFAWLLCAVFSFLILFLKSTCYGVADVIPGEEAAVSCAKYEALVAFSFLGFAAWTGCATIGGGLLFITIWKNARARSHNSMIGPTMYKAERRTTEDAAVSAPISPPAPAPVYFGETRGPVQADGPFTDPHETHSYYDARSEDKRPYSPEKRPMFVDEKGAYDEKVPYPAAYGSATYHVEDVGESHRGSKGAVPVVAAPIVPETSQVEEHWEPSEPEYLTAPGWGAGWIQRHWVLLGFLALIFAAVAIPMVILYAIPAFAFYIADNIKLPQNFYGAITGFHEDHATFDIHTSFRAPAGISATVLPTTLMLFLGDTIDDPIPVALVKTTALKIGGKEALVAYNQSLTLGNLTEWSRLWRNFAFQDTMQIGVGGEIKIKIGPITTSVKTAKVQTFQGLLNASKLELEYLRITPPAADGSNIEVAVPVTNPSPLTVDSKSGATFDASLGGTTVANLFLDEFKLQKGNGTIVARARLDPDIIEGVLGNFANILGSQLPAVGRGFAMATVQATSILQDGVAFPYWVAGAEAIKLNAAIELLPLIGGFAGDTLGDLLTGQAGEFLTLTQQTQVVDVNVTGINKILKTMKVYDAVAMGFADP